VHAGGDDRSPLAGLSGSDHLPLRAKLSFHFSCHHASDFPLCSDSNSKPVSTQLRWDKADRASYYYYTGLHLDPLLGIVDDMMKARQAGTADVDDVHKCIESVYSSVVSILNSDARLYVPECHKGFFKFWWSEELSLLKEASIHRIIYGKRRVNHAVVQFS